MTMRPFTSTISITEAQAIVADGVPRIERTERVPLIEARGRVLAGPILEEHDLPAPPVRPDHAQEVLVLLLRPGPGDHPRHIPGGDVDRPVEDPLGPVARDRHAHLLADVAVAGVQRGRLGGDRLIEHEHDRANAAVQPPFQPPLACFHVGLRLRNTKRGRFQR